MRGGFRIKVVIGAEIFARKTPRQLPPESAQLGDQNRPLKTDGVKSSRRDQNGDSEPVTTVIIGTLLLYP